LELSVDSQEFEVLDCHPLQRLFAACYVAAAALGLTLGLPQSLAEPGRVGMVSFAALGADIETVSRPIDISAALIGAGAIGNAFMVALSRINSRGTLAVVDPKRISDGNLNRCLCFDSGDVGRPKADVLVRKCQTSLPRVALTSACMTLHEFLANVPDGRIQMAISAVDSPRARRKIQNEMPFEIVDASTTEATEIVGHSHRQPTSGACLSCVYKSGPQERMREREIADGLGVTVEELARGFIDEQLAVKLIALHGLDVDPQALIGTSFDTLYRGLCSEQALLLPAAGQVISPFALVSGMAGALLVLELIRHQTGITRLMHQNYFFTSPWNPPHAQARYYLTRFSECEFCSDERRLLALRRLWADLI